MVDEIKSVSDLTELIAAAGYAAEHHAHLRYWFRGHALSTWALSPGVCRSDFNGLTDRDRLRIQQHINQDFRVYSSGIRSGADSDAELYFLQQHYGIPTMLLDWSHVPLAALFFAVSNRQHDRDEGEFFLMDAYALATDQREAKTACFEGFATSRHSQLQEFLRVVNEWKPPDALPKFILPVRPDRFDRRITQQHGIFTLHPPSRPVLTLEFNSTLRSFKIPATAKANIRRELTLLGIDDFTIFNDLEGLARKLKAAYLWGP